MVFRLKHGQNCINMDGMEGLGSTPNTCVGIHRIREMCLRGCNNGFCVISVLFFVHFASVKIE